MFHLFGGLIGEGHTEDFVGSGNAVADNIGHSMSQYTGLARARTRQNKQRTVHCLHSVRLGGIQIFGYKLKYIHDLQSFSAIPLSNF